MINMGYNTEITYFLHAIPIQSAKIKKKIKTTK
jgi:hypothetical protein